MSPDNTNNVVNISSPNPPVEVAHGITTTEFWKTLGALVVLALSRWLSPDVATQVASLVMFGLVTATYAISRALVKKGASK